MILPVIDSCDGCGACCMEQGSPPFIRGDERDDAMLASAPAEAREIIEAYHVRLLAGRVSGEGICVWLDVVTRQCKFYEHRPDICRDFERGCEGCRAWRKDYAAFIGQAVRS